MPDLLPLYHRLPYPMRVLAASARGHYLRHWRYGKETPQLVEAALSRENWSIAQWDEWQTQRLAQLLHRAATQVPFYRQQWQERRRKGDRASWELLENWPLLPKNSVRQTPLAFVADNCNPRHMFCEHTSGTTAKPLHLWWSKETVQAWYALFEARTRRWHGVSRHDRWAILGGQLVAPVKQQQPPFWVWNHGLRQLYLSAYHLKMKTAVAYLDALRQHQIVYMLGYPSGLYDLARLALELGVQPPPMRVVFSNAETLLAYQRETISRVFQCQVVDTYGMAEIVVAAGECQTGRLHLWPEMGILEVLAAGSDREMAAGGNGRFVATGLLNQDMPLIRYETGDFGTLATVGTTCDCGRKLPLLQQVEGRLDDAIITPDGRRIGRLDPVFKADLPVHEAQIVQEDRQHILVKLVPTDGYTAVDGQNLIQRIQDRVGDMDILIKKVSHIPRTANGKFRAVISHVDV